MQTPSIPNITNLGASPLTNKAPDSSTEPRFGQMLERQMSQRELAKPVEAPKQPAQRQETKAPSNNSTNTNNANNTNATNKSNGADSTTATASADKPEDASASTATATTTDTSTTAGAKTETTLKKEGKTATAKTASDETALTTPADATLAASAAVMALVANAGNKPSQPVMQADLKVAAETIEGARSGSNTSAVDIATKANVRDTITAATIDAAVAQAAKAGADGFGTSTQAAGKESEREAVALLPTGLTRGGSNDLAQITPQMQQTAFEIAPPTGGHPGDILAPRVGNDNWNQALGQRMVWMAAGAEQTASLTLNPPDLGPMQVVLHVSNGQADASFFAAQPEVRQALEAALPKLREMLSDAGVTLGQANVSAGQPQQQQASDRRASDSRTSSVGTVGATGAADNTNSPTSSGRRITGGNGMVDTFA